MRRRDLSKVLLATAVGSSAPAREAKAQACGVPPCYAPTPLETTLGISVISQQYLSYDHTGIILPQRYGFSPAASAGANSIALQTAINVLGAVTTFRDVGDGFAVNTYSGPELHLPEGLFNIGATIQLPECIVVRGHKTVLNQVSAADHFDAGVPYRIDIEGVTFRGGRSALNAAGSNQDSSRVRLARCEFQTANTQSYAVVVDTPTCNTLIEDCLVLNSPLFADIGGDFCEIRDCWVNGYLHSTFRKPNFTASVNNRARHMTVSGGSWVPEADGGGLSTGTRWFDNRGGLLTLCDVQFGGENGGLPIVYEYGSAINAAHPYISQNGVIIRGGQIAQGHASRADRGVVVLQGAVPSIIDIRGSMYVADGAIVSDAGFVAQTLAQWLVSSSSNYSPRIGIHIEDVGEHGSTFVPRALLPFARISKKSIGAHPGSRTLGALNEKITEFYPTILNSEAHIASNVSGQKRDPAAATWFDALLLTKEPNGVGGSGAAIIDLEAVAVGEIGGPATFVAQAKFRITFLAGRNAAIRSKVDVIAQNNDQTGGVAVGNVLECRTVGATHVAATVQLRVSASIAVGSAAVCWSARVVSIANSAGRVFMIETA